MTRPSSPEMDALCGREIKILDHGFVTLLDYMGSEQSIIDSARTSYSTGTTRVSEDRALIRYLMRNRHTSPFEMAEIKLHVKMPIFVARQWIRHRMASINEVSARYSVLDKEFYIPDFDDIAKQSKVNKQGRDEIVDHEIATSVRALLIDDASRAYADYEVLLGQEQSAAGSVHASLLESHRRRGEFDGISRELARMNLSLNIYTRWHWKIDVHNLLHFLSLRCDAHAQKEIRAYADAILGMLGLWMPNVHSAFLDYRLNAFMLSAPTLDIVKTIFGTADKSVLAWAIDTATTKYNLTSREVEEFKSAIGVTS